MILGKTIMRGSDKMRRAAIARAKRRQLLVKRIEAMRSSGSTTQQACSTCGEACACQHDR